ncbi:N-acetylneuraminate 7-O(or 9-O)-acetyltransferase [Aureococcus anophagefferens]|nr:N-acetylneuraminate 7-O(or 9-O)-acetyltransferase [Aureococcus anophagefferens]
MRTSPRSSPRTARATLDAAFAVVDGDAGGPVRRVAARAWAAALGELEGGACGVALPDAGDRFGSPAVAGRRRRWRRRGSGVAAGGATLETFAARLEAHCAGRPFHVAPDPDAAVAVRAGAGPGAPSRRRLADAHNKPTNPALVDTYYEDPLKDVRSTARASSRSRSASRARAKTSRPTTGRRLAEAFCLLAATPHVAFVGDSVTRFHYFIFNEWLATGRVDTRLKKLEDSKWADGEGSVHYDEASRWYDPDWSESSTHRQHFIKTHPPLFEDTVAPWADLVLANVGWWELKDCPCGDAYGFGDPAGCQGRLAQTLDDYATLLLDKVPAAYLRTSPCCGEYTTETCVDDDEDRDSRRVEAVKGVDHYNFLAGKFVSMKSGPPLPLLDVHGFSNQWNVYARTQDGRHPVAPLYHIWTQLLLSALAVDGRVFPARADGTRRSDAYKAGATRAPAPRPTSAPPTSVAPTSAHCADGARNAGETDTPEVELPEIRGKRQPAGAPRARAPEPGAAPATAAALELAAWVFVAAFCDAVAPSAVLPAGSRLLGENPDLWWFAMALLAVVCFAPPMVRTVGSDAADPALFFNRAQCNEWKGWMQVAFVAYHYANAQGVYVPIRWFVSAYVWLTGFGNARYFWKTSDFSGARFLKMVWRINCFAAPLSLATGTHWIAYYVVALHGARALLRGVRSGERVPPFGGYDLALRPALSSAFGAPFETYFWYRTRMDYLSSFFGAVFAAALPSVVAVWVVGDRSKTAKGAAAAFAAALAAAGAVAWATHAKPAAYRDVQPYVGTLWVPLYALLRNATPASRNSVSMPLEWVGARSLELYLLQFHLLMNRSAGGVLWLLPDEDWPLCNLALAATLWLVAAHRVFVRTAELRDAAEARPAPTAALLAAAAAVYGAMRALACAGGAVALGAAAVAAAGYAAGRALALQPPPPPAYAAVAVTEADDGDGEAPGSPGPPAREMV